MSRLAPLCRCACRRASTSAATAPRLSSLRLRAGVASPLAIDESDEPRREPATESSPVHTSTRPSRRSLVPPPSTTKTHRETWSSSERQVAYEILNDFPHLRDKSRFSAFRLSDDGVDGWESMGATPPATQYPNAYHERQVRDAMHCQEYARDDEVKEALDATIRHVEALHTEAELVDWIHKVIFTMPMEHSASLQEVDLDFDSDDVATTNAFIDSPLYPRILLKLIHRFAYHFHNPHLSLYVIDLAFSSTHSSRRLLNALTPDLFQHIIDIKWNFLADSNGALQALKDLTSSGLTITSQVRRSAEKVCRDLQFDEMEAQRLSLRDWNNDGGNGDGPSDVMVNQRRRFCPSDQFAAREIEWILYEAETETAQDRRRVKPF